MTRSVKSRGAKAAGGTAITFSADIRSALSELLSQAMADNFDLYSQTKVAHWNLKGPDFWSLHKMFDAVADMIEPFTDELAERLVLLGGEAHGSVRAAAKASRIAELPVRPHDGASYLEALRQRYGQHAAQLREAAERAAELGDPTTEDLFIEMTREVDQALYFIESHLPAGD